VTHLKHFDHIGVVVDDLEKAIHAFSKFFGLKCEKRLELEETGIRIAFYPLGSGRMELIQFQKPIDGVDPIVTRPHPGIQHIAFKVADFDAALEEYQEKGLKVIKGFPRQGAHGRVAFFYPFEGLNLLMEICEAENSKP
jgi:methylmalonyl-CoA/ethylmalonyl-CoA epimerase